MIDAIRQAGAQGKLLAASVENLQTWLGAGFLPAWALESVRELVEAGDWEELNNRFFKTIAFGTGGMRDRTFGYRMTAAEKGTPGPQGTPAHAGVGSTMMNDFNVVRATIGLYRYSAKYLEKKYGHPEQPRLVIAHDVRHFSRHFNELAASTWTKLGGTAFIFEGPRSTPQLSFSVRYLRATAGVVLTASHNPPEYNGVKAYFEDGGQVVPPHDTGIIEEVNAVDLKAVGQCLDVDLSKVVTLPKSADEAYQKALEENYIDPDLLRRVKPRVVFTPIHGTGGVGALPALRNAGVEVVTVDEQMVMDPRFPTVKSPNPEEGPALKMGMDKAEAVGADCVIGTDPDADRMGVAIRGHDGKLMLITGNTIGSLLAEYRVRALKAKGIIPQEGSQNVALIKTFVTTPLQAAIAKGHGLKLIDTLTGFKWIGEKLRQYEDKLSDGLMADKGIALDYDRTPPATRAALLQQYSTFYAFGGEESYGYLASDRVRDKDAAAAALMFCEMLAGLKAQGKTIAQFLDELYLGYGFFMESLLNIYYEGASGAQKIRNILESYRNNPPTEIGGQKVTSFRDFGVQTLHDADGKEIPKQDFYFVDLANEVSFAVRGSGTEPKIKFYFFGRAEVASAQALPAARQQAADTINAIKKAVDEDARRRAEG